MKGRLRVLGVDPGSRKAGWGLVDVDLATRQLSHVDNGAIFLDTKAELPARVVVLSQQVRVVLERFRPDVAAVEDVFVQRGARSALTLGQARGAVLATVGLAGVEVASHTAPQVKARVTGRGRATKHQVAEMVSLLLGLPEHPFEDAADALAVAVCHALEHLGLQAGLPAAVGQIKKPARGGRSALADLARAQGKI